MTKVMLPLLLSIVLLSIALPACALRYLSSDAKGIEFLWQGYASQSDETLAAIKTITSEDRTSGSAKACESFRVLPFLGIGQSKSGSFRYETDFPRIQYGASVMTASERLLLRWRPIFQAKLDPIISDWHAYQKLELNPANKSSQKQNVRDHLVQMCGEQAVRNAEECIHGYTDLEKKLILGSENGKFPAFY